MWSLAGRGGVPTGIIASDDRLSVFGHLRLWEDSAGGRVEVIPDGQDMAEVVVARAEDATRRAAVAAALAELRGEDRTLLAPRVGAGWSYDRIATELGLNPKTVGTRLFRP